VTQSRTRSTFVIAVAMVAMLAASMTAAFAQYPPATAYGVVCTVSGNQVACAVVGAQAGEQLAVTATCDGRVAYEQTLTADAAGEAAFDFRARGASVCEVSVLGAASGAAVTSVAGIGAAAEAAPEAGQALDRAAPGERRALPFTGTEVSVLLALGLGLVGLGTFAVRRRGAGTDAA
jgi:hypothetical protein